MCDRLEGKGLVRREPGPDRRTHAIAVTDAGRAIVDAVTDDRRRRLRSLVTAVPAEHRAVLAEALEAMAAAAGELPHEPSWAVGWAP